MPRIQSNKQYQAVGENIRNRREELGMSQCDLAFEIGCAVSSVSIWENGQRPPTLTSLFEIAEVLQCTAAELLPGKETEDTGDEQMLSVIGRLKALSSEQRSRALMAIDMIITGAQANNVSCA